MLQTSSDVVHHLRPEPMVGTTLWPLNALAAVSTTAHRSAVERYADRPGMLERPVEPLGCTWADCVFLCPVDPVVLVAAWRARRPATPPRDWLVIDAAALSAEDTVLHTPRGWDPGGPPPPLRATDCAAFTASALAEADRATRAVLARPAGGGARRGLFADVVHVLHRGPVGVDPERIVRA